MYDEPIYIPRLNQEPPKNDSPCILRNTQSITPNNYTSRNMTILSYMNLILSQNEGLSFSTLGMGGASTTVLHVSLPSMNRRYCRVLLSPSFSIVNDPNFDMPPEMYLCKYC